MPTTVNGSAFSERLYATSGQQTVSAGSGNDHIISLGDAGKPNAAKVTIDGKTGPLNQASETSGVSDDSANDTLEGGSGRDIFEFRALLNGTASVVAEHTGLNGVTNWGAVAGENDNWHDHWVEGFGLDTVLDYSKAENDQIVVRGHTVTLQGISYGSDELGAYSLITIYSQQGDGGAAGANTISGAHDEDPLGQIKVYGDTVTADDVKIIKDNSGIDQLARAEAAYGGEGTAVVYSNTDGDSYSGNIARQKDIVSIGTGQQTVNTGGGDDMIYLYSDGGEPDPAQGGSRVNPAIAEGSADDVVTGGQGRDTFAFRLLLNAKQEILDKHTRDDGSINWRRVAGENDEVHDHWVDGIGNDIIMDFSNQDGDRIDIQGHTVEIASITYGEDALGDFSVIALRSQQGDGGGAHDEDLLGTIKVYGDKVDADDLSVRAKVFYGIDELDKISAGEAEAPASNTANPLPEINWWAPNPETIDQLFTGTSRGETFHAGSGSQTITAGAGNDRLISYADAGEPDPGQTTGGEGRVYSALPASASDDVLTGGSGADRFEFHALLNAKREVIEQHTGSNGAINWAGVAGENDNVHDHWVDGIGNDIITDYSKTEGDTIVVRGHTMTLKSVTYGSDDGGDYSLITIYSQQGNGGAGGANTATGAHDEDPLGTIKVYGERVEAADIVIQGGAVVDGMDRLPNVDDLAAYNGGTQTFSSSTHGDVITTAPETIKTLDTVEIGSGAQEVHMGLGRDFIRVYADAGEPDPAQTAGAEGRIFPAVDPAMANDTISGGQGRDVFMFNALLNATDLILAKHTNSDGKINWRGVAGENDNVHDHWVEGIGDDVLLDYSNQDNDKIILRGHTVEIASITYGVDARGGFSLVTLRSQQGDGGGAHDEDPLGTLKVYGDKVTEDDLTVQRNVFDGIDIYEPITGRTNIVTGNHTANALSGTDEADIVRGGGGNDTLSGLGGDDTLWGQGGHDLMDGGEGSDTYLVTGTRDGHDTFADTGTSGTDTVLAGKDGTVIGIKGFGPANGIEAISSGGFADVTIRDHGGSEVLDFSGATLSGIAAIRANWGHDTITGTAAADVIQGDGGHDIMDGAEGGDTYLISGTRDGYDTFADTGTSGTDTVLAGKDGTVIGIKGFGPANGIEAISSGGFADVTIRDHGGSEVLDFSGATLSGITAIRANWGHDTITGTAAADVIQGDGGHDIMDGTEGGDTYLISGTRDGYDTFADTGTSGTDTVLAGKDGTVIGIKGFGPANGIEAISSGGFADVTIRDHGGSEVLDFSGITLSGIAAIRGNWGHDTITGTAAADVIQGDGGHDIMDGAEGGDTYLISGTRDGHDTFADTGTSGTDTVLAGKDGTVIGIKGFGPANGIEAISSGGFADVTIRDHGGSEVLDFSGITLSGITAIRANWGHDTITGTAAADVIQGDGGHDIMDGAEGGDTYLISGTRDGYDTFADTGTSGTDTVLAGKDATVIGIKGFGPANGIEAISSGGFADVTIRDHGGSEVLDFSGVTLSGIAAIRANWGHDTITGTAAADVIQGDGGHDIMDGAEGGDTYLISGTRDGYDTFADTGTSGTDTVLAGQDGTVIGIKGFDPANGIEAISSGGFADVTIRDHGGSEVLDFSGVTLSGITAIRANGGNDTITGSNADDTIYGDGGRDTFVFTQGGGHDVLADYNSRHDTVHLVGVAGVTSFTDVEARMSQDGANTVLALGTNDSLTFQDTLIDQLDAGDFIFTA